MFTLRPYQREAVDTVLEEYLVEGVRRQVVHAATGAGKTIIARTLASRLLKPGERCLFLAHRGDLLDQGMKAFLDPRFADPFDKLECGVVKAERDAFGCRVVFASIDTVTRPDRLARLLRKGRFKLVVTDECHHSVAKKYQRVFDAVVDPDTLHVGLTATPNRADGVSLKRVYEKRTVTIPILELIADELPALCDIRRVAVHTDLDLSDVEIVDDELNQEQLGRAVDKSKNRYDQIVAAICKHIPADWQGIYFGVNVKDAYTFAKYAEAAGITCATVTGETPDMERDEIYNAFRAGKVRMLSNVRVLTEGSDYPFVRFGVIACHTACAETYVQILGRLIRTLEGEDLLPVGERSKREAIALDVGGNTHKIVVASDLLGITAERMGSKSYTEILKEDPSLREEKPKLTWEPRPVSLALSSKSLFTDQRWIPTGDGYKLKARGVDGVVICERDLTGYRPVFYGDDTGLGRRKELAKRPVKAEFAFGIGEQYLLEQASAQRYRERMRTDDALRNRPATPEKVARAAKIFPPFAKRSRVTEGELRDFWDMLREARGQGYKSYWDAPGGQQWRAQYMAWKAQQKRKTTKQPVSDSARQRKNGDVEVSE